MLTCSNLKISLQNGRTLVPTFNFSLSHGEKLAIISEEGNGKSTLLKVLCGIDCDYVKVEGTIYNTETISYLPQSMPSIWNDATPLDFLLKENIEDEIEDYNLCIEIDNLCKEMNVDSHFIYSNQCISTLSGGEKVKLQLVKMKMKPASLYCLDEPTNDLDMNTLIWLEQWIRSTKESIIYISHDTTLLKNTSTRILHLEQRNKKTKPVITLFSGNYSDYIQQREQSRKKDIQLSSNEKKAYLKQKQKLNDLHNKVQSDLRSVSRQRPHEAKVLKNKMKTIKSSQSHLEQSSYLKLDSYEEEINIFFDQSHLPKTKEIIEYTNKSIQIEDKTLINPFSLSIYGQDKICITGNNGCGKSLLVKDMYQQLKNRKDIVLGYMPQNYSDFFYKDDTPISFLQRFDFDITSIQSILGSLKIIESEMNQNIFNCSLGQQAKIYFAYLILKKSNVLLLDEPTRNISPLSIPVWIQALNDFEGCIICVSHDRYFIKKVFNTQIIIENNNLKSQSL
ncbi:ATP-binding cassette domain-containing protein [Floccifex sp.]|uniref:ATP-binding cassette domain-containing protein n=1 Tax=Floccifex sp. TaxID=2815810 RepID=UPI003F0D2A95